MKISRRGCFALALARVPAFSQDLIPGKFLVATRSSKDPDFARSIILLVYAGKEGYLGLMVNRPWNVPVTQLFPELKQAQAKLYEGGPVAVGVRGLLRSRTKPAQGELVFGDVYVITSVKVLQQMLAANPPENAFRVYGGSVGWSVTQLKDEVARGLWRVVRGDAATVFDPNPQTLWPRWIAR